MSTIDSIFDSTRLEKAIATLASTVPYPGEGAIRDTLAACRKDMTFSGVNSCRYPEIPSIRAFRSKMCDLRGSATVWVEFKHGTSKSYIQSLGFKAQGTTKDLFRNACMDLAKVTLINQAKEFTGMVILSALHVGELQDAAFAKVKEELEALATVFHIAPEQIDYPYSASEGERSVAGVLSIFAFGRPVTRSLERLSTPPGE